MAEVVPIIATAIVTVVTPVFAFVIAVLTIRKRDKDDVPWYELKPPKKDDDPE